MYVANREKKNKSASQPFNKKIVFGLFYNNLVVWFKQINHGFVIPVLKRCKVNIK